MNTKLIAQFLGESVTINGNFFNRFSDERNIAEKHGGEVKMDGKKFIWVFPSEEALKAAKKELNEFNKSKEQSNEIPSDTAKMVNNFYKHKGAQL